MTAQARHKVFPARRAGAALRFLGGVGAALLRPRLDIASLPDHLKRDLGFATGRPTAPRDPLKD